MSLPTQIVTDTNTLNLRTNSMSNDNQIEQEQIIEAIIERIKDEDKKHSKSIEDWYRIAANKIYATFDIKIKENYEQ